MVGTIETIHAIKERENIIDARTHPVSLCLNSSALFPFKLRPRRLVLSGLLRSPQTRIASGCSRRLHENQQTQLRKRVFFTRREHIFCLHVITRGIEHSMK